MSSKVANEGINPIGYEIQGCKCLPLGHNNHIPFLYLVGIIQVTGSYGALSKSVIVFQMDKCQIQMAKFGIYGFTSDRYCSGNRTIRMNFQFSRLFYFWDYNEFPKNSLGSKGTLDEYQLKSEQDFFLSSLWLLSRLSIPLCSRSLHGGSNCQVRLEPLLH